MCNFLPSLNSFISFYNLLSSFYKTIIRAVRGLGFCHGFFTGSSLRHRADISKVTAHERIQQLYQDVF
jgi:hypothetical protein